MENLKTSPKFTLNLLDLGKGIALAAITAGLNVLVDSLEAGTLQLDWPGIGRAALIGAVAYLAKNFLSGPPPTPKPSAN